MQLMRGRRQERLSRQRGLSIVELMVGITIGLIVAAAAAVMSTNQIVDNRRLLLETQLQQDLRAATDIITRELRRAGADTELRSLRTLWFPGKVTAVEPNAYAAMTPASGVSATEANFTYNPGGGADGAFGFKLEGGVIKTRLVAGGWQDLTDSRVMEVMFFSVTRLSDEPVQLPCPKACADNTGNCWPTVLVRNLTIQIRARSAGAPTIERSILSRVRVRNDHVQFANGSTTQVCPL
jgi:prepilin-type N-terminal cleavage/methylation domain-containing protein